MQTQRVHNSKSNSTRNRRNETSKVTVISIERNRGTDEESGVEGDGEEEVGEGEAEEGDGGGGDPVAAGREVAEARREGKEIRRGRESGIGDEASEADLPLLSQPRRVLVGVFYYCQIARHFFPSFNSNALFF